MLTVGAVLGGRLRVDRLLGAGGMGIVVAATHLELDQLVAVKLLHEELAGNPTIVARFLREARAVARLRTEHVCRVHDVGRLDNGAPYIVMELLEGTDLGAVVIRGPVPSPLAVEYIVQACVAIAEAHAAGVVHRDLKPANLFVCRRHDGRPLIKVLDFGIAKAATAAEAKLTHTTSTIGSPGFMSPEQIKSARDVDLRTDIWALGVTLYQLLSGRMPFRGVQLTELAVNIGTQPPLPLPVELDPRLQAIVLRCLEKDPDRRFQDVAALATALAPFGGAAAPEFVTLIPGARPAVTERAPPPVVAASEITAASLRAIPSAVTPPTIGATNAGSRVVPATETGTRHGVESVNLATRAGATAPSPVPAAPASLTPARPTRLPLVIGLGAVLLGGGVFAGYLMRGSAREVTPPPGPSPGPVGPGADARLAPEPDAATATVQAPVDAQSGDPWANHEAGVPADAGPPPDARVPNIQLVDSDGKPLPPGNPRLQGRVREMMRSSLQGADYTISYVGRDPAQLLSVLVGYTNAACQLGEIAIAQRLFDRVRPGREREELRVECAELRVPLVDRAPPAQAGSGAGSGSGSSAGSSAGSGAPRTRKPGTKR